MMPFIRWPLSACRARSAIFRSCKILSSAILFVFFFVNHPTDDGFVDDIDDDIEIQKGSFNRSRKLDNIPAVTCLDEARDFQPGRTCSPIPIRRLH